MCPMDAEDAGSAGQQSREATPRKLYLHELIWSPQKEEKGSCFPGCVVTNHQPARLRLS